MKIKLNVTTKELINYNFSEFGALVGAMRLKALQRKEEPLELKCTVILDDDFDEADFEKYIERIKEIDPNILHIKLGKNNKKPTYKALVEVHDALGHFGKLERVKFAEGQQIYRVEKMDMTVIFNHIPE